MADLHRFSGKTAIVTGAGGDIGRIAALRFAREGASVVAVDMDADALSAVVDEIKSGGGSAVAVTADVTRGEDVRSYVANAVDSFGGVDILFNNAGIEGVVEPVEDYPEDMFDKVIAVNVRGVFLGMKYVVPAMRERGSGVIVNTASVAGLSGSAGVCAYNASKHAVIGLTRSAAAQLGAENIRVNAICPSPIEGRMIESLEEGFAPGERDQTREQISATIPMQRYGKPAEVIGLVTYLCSDDAAFLNGGAYTVDGGMTAT